MALLSFFKRTTNQKFEYNPRFWNPQKEDLYRRIEEAKSKSSDDPEAMKARISSGLRKGNYMVDRSTRSQYMYRRNMMLIGIIVILFFVTYLLLVKYLPRIEAVMGGAQTI